MNIKKSRFEEESIKLISLYKQCLEYSAISQNEEIFITDILATVYICNNIYLNCEKENIRGIKRLITEIDANLTSLYFKSKNKDKGLTEYKKQIKLKIKLLDSFLKKVINEK